VHSGDFGVYEIIIIKILNSNCIARQKRLVYFSHETLVERLVHVLVPGGTNYSDFSVVDNKNRKTNKYLE